MKAKRDGITAPKTLFLPFNQRVLTTNVYCKYIMIFLILQIMKNLFSRIGDIDAYSSTIVYYANGVKNKADLFFSRLENSNKYYFYIGGNAAANEYILKSTKKHEVKRDEFNFIILKVRKLMQDFNPITAKIDIRLAELEKEKAELEGRLASIEAQRKELEGQREEKLFQKGGDPYEQRKINF